MAAQRPDNERDDGDGAQNTPSSPRRADPKCAVRCSRRLCRTPVLGADTELFGDEMSEYDRPSNGRKCETDQRLHDDVEENDYDLVRSRSKVLGKFCELRLVSENASEHSNGTSERVCTPPAPPVVPMEGRGIENRPY